MMKIQRYKRWLAEARDGDEISALHTFKQEIEAQKTRMNASHNGIIRQCSRQEIDQLRAEKEAIELESVG